MLIKQAVWIVIIVILSVLTSRCVTNVLDTVLLNKPTLSLAIKL
jgi:hypothetical protein